MVAKAKRRLVCRETSKGGRICRVVTRKAGRTRAAQRLVKAIRAIDRNAELDGITHNVAELRAILDFLLKDR